MLQGPQQLTSPPKAAYAKGRMLRPDIPITIIYRLEVKIVEIKILQLQIFSVQHFRPFSFSFVQNMIRNVASV